MEFNVIFSIQAVVAAYDTAYPQNRATGTVTFIVERNLNAPGFPTTSYTRSFADTTNIGTELLDLNPTDKDGVSLQSLSYILCDSSIFMEHFTRISPLR